MADGEKLIKRNSDPAAAAADVNARSRSEAATLALAVMVAVGLGVGLGMWVTARLPPASSAVAHTPARLLPDARNSAPPANAAQPSPCAGCETAPAGGATTASAPAVDADESGPTADPGASKGVAREATPDTVPAPGRADEVSKVNAESRGVTKPEAVASTSSDPSRPVAWEVGASSKPRARANAGQGAAQAVERRADGRAQAQPGPCALYTSASVLRVHAGGASPLILGGPGVGVRINVTTPDWSELAVIYEGPAAGPNGWLKYSVRSVGRRPGLYTVRVSSPCGAQTIPVTVK
jgi:hypothetical protein